MEAAEQLATLKEKQSSAKAKLDGLVGQKADLDRRITEAKIRLSQIEQDIFKKENVVFLEAAKKAVAASPEFAKMVKTFTEEIQVHAAGKPPKKAAK